MNGCKELQFVNGVGILEYWLGNWLFDVAVFLVPALLMAVPLKAAEVDSLTGPDTAGPFMAIMILFVFAQVCLGS